MNDNLEKDTMLTDSELEELLDEDDLDNVAGAGSITRPMQSLSLIHIFYAISSHKRQKIFLRKRPRPRHLLPHARRMDGKAFKQRKIQMCIRDSSNNV